MKQIALRAGSKGRGTIHSVYQERIEHVYVGVCTLFGIGIMPRQKEAYDFLPLQALYPNCTNKIQT